MAGLRQSVHQGTPAELGRDTLPVTPPDVVALLHQMGSPESTLADIPLSATRETGMVCFSCGRSGHGVSRCSRVDTTFPFVPPGWSVDFRGRSISGSVAHGSAEKSRLIRAGGSASRISNTSSSNDPGGGEFATPNKQNKPTWVSPVVHHGLPSRSHNLRNCSGVRESRSEPSPAGPAIFEAAVNDIQIDLCCRRPIFLKFREI